MNKKKELMKLSFKYWFWVALVPHEEHGKMSQKKMKSYVTDSIKDAILKGVYNENERECPLFLSIPYFNSDTFKNIDSIKVRFAEKNPFSYRNLPEKKMVEVIVDGPITVEVSWKFAEES